MVGVGFLVALLVQYPSETLAVTTVIYLALIPVSMRRYRQKLAASGDEDVIDEPDFGDDDDQDDDEMDDEPKPAHSGQVVGLRRGERS